MRFIQGVIVGAAVVVLSAYIHDHTDGGSIKPLVNWPNASELQHDTYDYVMEQFDRMTKWLKSR
jgi:hypothetical protein